MYAINPKFGKAEYFSAAALTRHLLFCPTDQRNSTSSRHQPLRNEGNCVPATMVWPGRNQFLETLHQHDNGPVGETPKSMEIN